MLLPGAFVALHDDLGWRRMAPPYRFGKTAVDPDFAIGLVGIASSA